MTQPATPSPVAIVQTEPECPAEPPFHPNEAYPEYGGRPLAGEKNAAYGAVRACFRLLGYDAERFGTSSWNPLGFLIKPGQRVFIKPNLVAHEYRSSKGRHGSLFSVITHPSIVRAVADYAAIALQGRGEILIGDNPSIDADFAKQCEQTHLPDMAGLYPQLIGVGCRVLDLRPARTDNLAYYGFKTKLVKLSGDPAGSSVLNLGDRSLFRHQNPLLFRGVFTKRWETIRHHHGKVHEYCISNSILNADVYISIPKLKTHHKVGCTLNIKGLVGINANKNYLVHWRVGFPSIGGDEYPQAPRWADSLLFTGRHLLLDLLPESWFLGLRKRFGGTRWGVIFHDTRCFSFDAARNSWDGNDTCWRMAADLYNVFVRDLSGWRRDRRKIVRFFSVIDGLLAGEEDGPFYPLEKRAGAVLAGENLLHVDTAAARLMGFQVQAVPYLSHLLAETGVTPDQIPIVSNHWPGDGFFQSDDSYLNFVPPTQWPKLVKRHQTP